MPSVEGNSGTLLHTAGGYFAQFSIGNGQRKGTLLRTCKTEEAAERRKLAISKLVTRLRETGYVAVIPNMIRDAGALDEEGMRKLARLVERIAKGKEPGLSQPQTARREAMTVCDLAELWTSGDLAKQYPDHVRIKKAKSSRDDARMFEWLGKVRMPDGTTFGARAIAAITLDDCDHAMRALPKGADSPSTRRSYAIAIRKLLVYAVYPLRLLPSLPIPNGWLPKSGNGKAKAWVYPAEDLAVMQCREIPLARRLFFGLIVREGLRVGEAISLRWPDLDLERGVLRLDVNKTDDPRSWAMGEDVARALNAWRELRGSKAKKVPLVFPKALLGDRGDLAHWLREGLKLAGVMRPELTVVKKGRMLLRVHDLRGSFVTLALAAGKTEAWVTDRTGHRSSQMIYLYKRASRTAAELGLGWFAPLDEAIPELAPKTPKGANGVQMGGPAPTQTTRRGSRNVGKSAISGPVGTLKREFVNRRSGVQIPKAAPLVSGSIEPVGANMDEDETGIICTSFAPPPLKAQPDAVDQALERGLLDAAFEGRIEDVQRLAREIRSRTLARNGVIGIADRRRTR